MLSFGEARIDTRQATVWRGDRPLPLSEKEYRLLHFLVTHPSETIPRDRLLEELWDYPPGTRTRTVEVHVNSIRSKIEDDPKNPRWIRTVYGKGYQFLPD